MVTHKKIGFIGAGKVGLALGLYFYKNGIGIAGYYSRGFSDAQRAAAVTHSQPFFTIEALAINSDVLWITTNDDNIETVAMEIAKYNIEGIGKKIIVHSSGVHTSALLVKLSQMGCSTASVHPLLAISDVENAIGRLAQTFFTVEGNKKAVDFFQDFFRAIGNTCLQLKPEQKSTYHLAAVLLSNYMVTLYDISNQLLALSGISTDEPNKLLMPLLESVAENLKNKNTQDALTGPIKRNDKETVQKHLNTLYEKMPELLPLYKELGKYTADMIGNNAMIDLFE